MQLKPGDIIEYDSSASQSNDFDPEENNLLKDIKKWPNKNKSLLSTYILQYVNQKGLDAVKQALSDTTLKEDLQIDSFDSLAYQILPYLKDIVKKDPDTQAQFNQLDRAGQIQVASKIARYAVNSAYKNRQDIFNFDPNIGDYGIPTTTPNDKLEVPPPEPPAIPKNIPKDKLQEPLPAIPKTIPTDKLEDPLDKVDSAVAELEKGKQASPEVVANLSGSNAHKKYKDAKIAQYISKIPNLSDSEEQFLADAWVKGQLTPEQVKAVRDYEDAKQEPTNIAPEVKPENPKEIPVDTPVNKTQEPENVIPQPEVKPVEPVSQKQEPKPVNKTKEPKKVTPKPVAKAPEKPIEKPEVNAEPVAKEPEAPKPVVKNPEKPLPNKVDVPKPQVKEPAKAQIPIDTGIPGPTGIDKYAAKPKVSNAPTFTQIPTGLEDYPAILTPIVRNNPEVKRNPYFSDAPNSLVKSVRKTLKDKDLLGKKIPSDQLNAIIKDTMDAMSKQTSLKEAVDTATKQKAIVVSLGNGTVGVLDLQQTDPSRNAYKPSKDVKEISLKSVIRIVKNSDDVSKSSPALKQYADKKKNEKPIANKTTDKNAVKGSKDSLANKALNAVGTLAGDAGKGIGKAAGKVGKDIGKTVTSVGKGVVDATKKGIDKAASMPGDLANNAAKGIKGILGKAWNYGKKKGEEFTVKK
jgi:hypothetical protein